MDVDVYSFGDKENPTRPYEDDQGLQSDEELERLIDEQFREPIPPVCDDDFVEPEEEEDRASNAHSSQRGPSRNPKSGKLNSHDGKIILRYNAYGVPIGPEATALSTFIGVLAQTSVLIIYNDWRKVPDKYKEALWSFVQKRFLVQERSNRQILQAIGKSFRNDYILLNKHNRKRLRKLPLRFHYIR